MKKLVLAGTLPCAVFTMVSCKEECPVVGERWCFGDVLKYCGETEIGPSFGRDSRWVMEQNCSEFESQCMESGDGKAACVLSKQPCPDSTERMCFENRIVDCTYHLLPGYPVNYILPHDDNDYFIVAVDCSDTDKDTETPPLCVTIDEAPNAVCAYYSDSCEYNEQRCFAEYPASRFFCEEHGWTSKTDCPSDAGVCVQVSETVTECQ